MTDDVDRFVGSRLRERRLILNKTIEELAESLPFTIDEIAAFESGNERIGSANLHALSQLLKVKITYFFDGLSYEG
ncbi:MAG: helix-turn-helix transcriptional regulator [Chloroflexota bacterium]